jgi:hypothetical protein
MGYREFTAETPRRRGRIKLKPRLESAEGAEVNVP